MESDRLMRAGRLIQVKNNRTVIGSNTTGHLIGVAVCGLNTVHKQLDLSTGFTQKYLLFHMLQFYLLTLGIILSQESLLGLIYA